MTDRDVTDLGGISVGQRVKLRAEVLAELRVRGMSAGWLERHGGAATVDRIVVSNEHGWNSASVRFDGKSEDWFPVDDLEAARPLDSSPDPCHVAPTSGNGDADR